MAITKISTASIEDDAITSAKIPANAVGTSEIAADAVTSTQIDDNTIVAGDIADATITLAKLEHGTSSNDGKFLRANNGADPSFETIDLTALSASNLTSGTVPDARFPATLPAISGANLTNLPASGKATNLVINGGMEISQRGTSFSLTGSGYTLDRFTQSVGSSFTMDTTITQSTDAPDTFKNSLKVTPDSTQTPTGSHNGTIVTRFEGQDLVPIGYGTSSCKQITLSFYAKSSSQNNGQTYTVQINKSLLGAQKYVTKTFDITSSWQRFTMTFPADTATATDENNIQGMAIYWHLASGPDDIVSESASSWVSQNGFRAATGQDNFFDNTSNEFYLTGVQLEVGDSASDFAHESYAETLAKCQRYLYVAIPTGTRGGFTECATMYTDGEIFGSVNFPVEMRTTPSLAYSNVSQYFIAYSANNNALFSTLTLESTVSSPSVGAAYANVGSTSGDWTGNSAMWRDHNDNAYIYFEAEL